MFQGKLSMESEREQCVASDASVVPSLSLSLSLRAVSGCAGRRGCELGEGGS